MKKIRSYFTLKFHYSAFQDRISGKKVCMYVDCFGDLYLKDNRWSFFSVLSGSI